MKILLIYLVIINIVGLLAFYIDKQKAKKNKWRIPEARLFYFALLGGGIGCWLGMQLFRHKTQHKSFAICIPLITIMEYGTLLLLYVLYFNKL